MWGWFHRRILDGLNNGRSDSPAAPSISFRVASAVAGNIPLDVDQAVEDQLTFEHPDLPHKPGKKMDEFYGYQEGDMRTFLLAVAHILAQKGHKFSVTTTIVYDVLSKTLDEMKLAIMKATK